MADKVVSLEKENRGGSEIDVGDANGVVEAEEGGTNNGGRVMPGLFLGKPLKVGDKG
jgi:hypothetical protein